MDKELLSLLCSPVTHLPFEYIKETSGEYLQVENKQYPILDDIPIFLDENSLNGMNQKYQKFYDRVGWAYQLSANITASPSSKKMEEMLGDFIIPQKANVLETSVGTGNNLRYLAKKFPHANYWGMDISLGMMNECKKWMKKNNLPLRLCQANAEQLPYKDNSFDFVFHVGGINFFDDKQAAINEMIRVAKPESKIIVIDETSKWVKNIYQKLPFVSNYYQEMDNPELTNAPIDLLPETIKDINLSFLWKGGMYKLSFKK